LLCDHGVSQGTELLDQDHAQLKVGGRGEVRCAARRELAKALIFFGVAHDLSPYAG
jgi:hypothetical protein